MITSSKEILIFAKERSFELFTQSESSYSFSKKIQDHHSIELLIYKQKHNSSDWTQILVFKGLYGKITMTTYKMEFPHPDFDKYVEAMTFYAKCCFDNDPFFPAMKAKDL